MTRQRKQVEKTTTEERNQEEAKDRRVSGQGLNKTRTAI